MLKTKKQPCYSSGNHSAQTIRGRVEKSNRKETMIATITRSIRRKTGNRVHDLYLLITSHRITLKGVCNSFHVKQLAQEAVLQLGRFKTVSNEIQVR